MIKYLIALVLVSSFPAIAWAWGHKKTAPRGDHRHVESTYKQHRPIGSFKQQRKTEEVPDSSFYREYLAVQFHISRIHFLGLYRRQLTLRCIA